MLNTWKSQHEDFKYTEIAFVEVLAEQNLIRGELIYVLMLALFCTFAM